MGEILGLIIGITLAVILVREFRDKNKKKYAAP
jgi:hypothetical protein